MVWNCFAFAFCLAVGPACPSEEEVGCGDGIVAEDETCDDGNDLPDDGCTECQRSGVVEWTYRHGGARKGHDDARAVAIDTAGRILVAGHENDPSYSNSDILLIALDPAGQELWRRSIDGGAGLNEYAGAIVVDASGNIYVGGIDMIDPTTGVAAVRAFDRDGGLLWTYKDQPVFEGSGISDLVLADGALFSAGSDSLSAERAQVAVRRHDPATGTAVWVSTTRADHMDARAYAIAAVGTELVVVGSAGTVPTLKPLVARFTSAGALVSIVVDDMPGHWTGVQAIGPDGDLVLVGRLVPDDETGGDLAIRRVGADLGEQWTVIHDLDHGNDGAYDVAVGPDDALFVVGSVTRTVATRQYLRRSLCARW